MRGSISNLGKVAGTKGLNSGLNIALQQCAMIKPPGHKGGQAMDVPEEEEIIERQAKLGQAGGHRGGFVMEYEEEEPQVDYRTSLLGKLAYQVCKDDIHRLKTNQAVSMVSQNILASSLGTGFAAKNQNLLTKQSQKAR